MTKLKLTTDYSFGYIGDHTKVYTIVRRPLSKTTKNIDSPKHVINPLRYLYYTEPFESKMNNLKENVLIGFKYKQDCRLWHKQIIKDNLEDSNPNTSSLPDDMFDNRLTIRLHRLYEYKVIANALHLPVVVVLDNDKTQLELYYFKYMSNNK
jgi:hypothetical protein